MSDLTQPEAATRLAASLKPPSPARRANALKAPRDAHGRFLTQLVEQTVADDADELDARIPWYVWVFIGIIVGIVIAAVIGLNAPGFVGRMGE